MASRVIVFQKGEKKGQVWEGDFSNALLLGVLVDYDVSLSPGNALVVSENGKLSGPQIRCIYNESAWKQVVLDDGQEKHSDTE